MRPRDLTARIWSENGHELSLRSGLSIFINWRGGGMSLTMVAASGQFTLAMSRRVWDKIVDWYTDSCDERFWKTSKDSIQMDAGARMPKGRFDESRREWEAIASPHSYVEDKDGCCSIARVDRKVLIRCHGLIDDTAMMWIRREDMDRIVAWYNTDLTKEKAA